MYVVYTWYMLGEITPPGNPTIHCVNCVSVLTEQTNPLTTKLVSFVRTHRDVVILYEVHVDTTQ